MHYFYLQNKLDIGAEFLFTIKVYPQYSADRQSIKWFEISVSGNFSLVMNFEPFNKGIITAIISSFVKLPLSKFSTLWL
jgi:hypothetical protein